MDTSVLTELPSRGTAPPRTGRPALSSGVLSRPPRLTTLRRSARVRILGWYVVLLAVAIGASLLVERQVLLVRLGHRTQAELAVDADALNKQAHQGGGQGSVEALFSAYLKSHLPGPNSEFLTLVGGRPYLASAGGVFPLTRVPGLVGQAARSTRVSQGSLDSPAGRVQYLAVPVTQAGSVPGVFLDAAFTRAGLDEVNQDVAVAAAVSFTMLLVMSLIAWAVAGRVLAPVRVVTETALNISETDLTRRIPAHGDDEITAMTGAFNSMLDRLQNAFESQGHFVSDASHELKTPITVIRGHLELLGEDPRDRAETMAIVNDELDRMSRMVEELLVLAKAERPGFLRLAPLDMGAFLGQLTSKVSTLGPRDWKCAVQGNVSALADRQRLTQAVMNLVNNAVSHTGPGDRITLGLSVPSPSTYRLWVSDTGSGILTEDRVRVFDRFARGRNERRSGQGTGLGLAIVKAVAEAHRGTVELDSVYGRGATFSLVLPVHPTEEERR